jgi:hypothetical protein
MNRPIENALDLMEVLTDAVEAQPHQTSNLGVKEVLEFDDDDEDGGFFVVMKDGTEYRVVIERCLWRAQKLGDRGEILGLPIEPIEEE